jgi:hypothetical protein
MWNLSSPYTLKRHLGALIHPFPAFSFSPDAGCKGNAK